MGFCLPGLVVSLAVLAPNLLLLRWPPRDPLPDVEARVPAVLRWAERAGQVACLAVPAIVVPDGLTWWWFLPVAVGLAAYLALWARYLLTGRRAAALYRWRRVPVPMAVLPVVVFLGTAGWLGSPWVAVAAAVLAVGHVPTSLVTARMLEEAG